MASVIMYSSAWCPYCIRAKALLDSKQIPYQDLSVDGNPQRRREMSERSGRTSVPQIWIAERHIGGCDELYALERADQLDALLQA